MKTLNEKSILVSLVIAQWAARKYDKKATAEVNENHNSKDAGRFNKSLVAREHLQAITKIANAARTFHYENTLPWNDGGERLLPSDNYFAYTSELSKLKNQYESEVNKFALAYPGMIEEAKVNLNGLFNANDYPMNIRERFTIRTSFMPVPDVADLRINLSTNEVNNLREAITTEVNERYATAQKSVYDRITEQLKYMFDRLQDKDAIFRDSLFDNVLALVELLPRLNVSEDKRIDELCKDLKSLYTDPEEVRTNKKLRNDKAHEVENILSKIDSFFK